jgi:hypothetical protein
MADEEHLALLKQGEAAWNAWRTINPRIYPNLGGAQLDGVDLRGFHPNGAHLEGTSLRKADLAGAHLYRAHLDGADLREADLHGAFLSGALFEGTRLNRALLCGALLRGALFREADLYEADLHEATIGLTILGDVDPSMVRGLDTVQHKEPSTIGIDTLYRSHGNIPEVFLRGAGVPEDIITYMKSQVGRPFEFYSCFISYSHADQSFARRLHDQLQGRGIRCWLDEHQLLPGDDIYEQIDRGIRF